MHKVATQSIPEVHLDNDAESSGDSGLNDPGGFTEVNRKDFSMCPNPQQSKMRWEVSSITSDICSLLADLKYQFSVASV